MKKQEARSKKQEVDAIGQFPAMISAINNVRWNRSGLLSVEAFIYFNSLGIAIGRASEILQKAGKAGKWRSQLPRS